MLEKIIATLLQALPVTMTRVEFLFLPLVATLFRNVKQMVDASSYYNSEYCTVTVFTARACILQLSLFCVSICVPHFVLCLRCNVQLWNLSPTVCMYYRKSFIFSLTENGIIKSEKVYEVMLATDRSHFSRCNPYMDSPQSIGTIPEPVFRQASS